MTMSQCPLPLDQLTCTQGRSEWTLGMLTFDCFLTTILYNTPLSSPEVPRTISNWKCRPIDICTQDGTGRKQLVVFIIYMSGKQTKSFWTLAWLIHVQAESLLGTEALENVHDYYLWALNEFWFTLLVMSSDLCFRFFGSQNFLRNHC
jgi:hypothetical protein